MNSGEKINISKDSFKNSKEEQPNNGGKRSGSLEILFQKKIFSCQTKPSYFYLTQISYQ